MVTKQEEELLLIINQQCLDVSPASTIYGQYRTLVLEDENGSFLLVGVTGSSIYAISVERSAYKQSLFPGSLNVILTRSYRSSSNFN